MRSPASGERVDEATYGPIALRHRAPATPPAATPNTARFRIDQGPDHHDLVRTDRAEPLCSLPREHLQGDQLHVAPDGQTAIAQPKQRGCLLFRVGSNTPRGIWHDHAYGFVWLPAAR